MASKRGSRSGHSNPAKRSRQAITLRTKLLIINRSENGERLMDISRSLNLAGSTVRTILNNAEKIKLSAQSATDGSALRVTKGRDPVMEKMEKVLSVWIEEQNERGVPLSLMSIQEKARCLWRELKAIEGEGFYGEPFKASHGWFERFKRRANLQHISVTAVTKLEEAGTNAFPDEPICILEEGGADYSPNRVSDVEESGTFWKRAKPRDFLLCAEKADPGHVASLVDGQADSDSKLKAVIARVTRNAREQKEYLDEEDCTDASSPPKQLFSDGLLKALDLFEQGMAILKLNDTNKERSTQCCREIQAALSCYKDLYTTTSTAQENSRETRSRTPTTANDHNIKATTPN